MGLTLFYQGRIKSMQLIPALVSEVIDICDSMNWSYQMNREKIDLPSNVLQQLGLDPNKKLQLQGITFQPHEKCESVALTFLPTGQMTFLPGIIMADAFPDPKMAFTIFTKTQFAGPEIHMVIVKLLKYLEKKYLCNLIVSDEGQYWETNDEHVLRKRFATYGFLLESVEKALNDMYSDVPEDPEELIKQIEAMLRRMSRKQ